MRGRRLPWAALTLAVLSLALPGRHALGQPQPAAPARTPRKLALLVAISRYSQHPLPPGKTRWDDLHCESDALALRDVLTSPRLGFAEGDVLLLRDEQATHAGIVKAIQEHLIAQAQPGDAVLFYYAGHGQQLRELVPGSEIDGLDESLVPFDNNGQAADDAATINLRDDELGTLLTQLTAKVRGQATAARGNVTVMLDCCCSGSATRGAHGAFIPRGRGWDETLDGKRPTPQPVLAGDRGFQLRGYQMRGKDAGGFVTAQEAGAGYVALAACESDQSAKEFEVADGEFHGALSYYLVDALRQATPQTTYGELLSRVSARLCAARVPDQTPLLEGRSDQLLFGSGVADVPPTVTVTAVGAADLTLPLGELHGITLGSVFSLFGPTGPVTPDRRLAEAAVTRVGATTCRAELTAAWRGKVTPDALRLARAMETAHSYDGQALRVLVDSPTWRQRVAGLPMVVTAGVTPSTCDVQLLARDGRLVLEGRGLRTRGETPPVLGEFSDAPTSSSDVLKALRGQWRWQMLAQLQNNGGPHPVEVRVVQVAVALEADGEHIKAGSARRVGLAEGRGLRLREGDYVMVEVRNSGPEKLHVAVLDLSPDGAIAPLFPHPDHPAENLIANDGQWRAVPSAADPSVFHLSAPLGTELFKAIATRERVDFTLLAQRAAVGATRGLGTGFDNPLALLFDGIATTRGASLAPVSRADWYTAEAVFEIGAR